MTNDRLAASLDALNDKLGQRFAASDARFDRIDAHFDRIEMRLQTIELHMATKSNVSVAVFQAVGVLYVAIIGTVVGLSAIGAFG